MLRRAVPLMRALRSMSCGELVFRSRLGLAKKFNRWLDRPGFPTGEVVPRLVFPGLREEGARRFLEGLRTCDELVLQAEEIGKGTVRLYGMYSFPLRDNADWHRGLPGDVEFERVNFARCRLNIPGADVRILWEVNRHQFLTIPARAYVLTGDERHAETVVRYLRSWMESNPYGVGVNWTSALEVGVRAISWVLLYHLLSGTQAFKEMEAGFMGMLHRHGHYLDRYATTGFNLNNHIIGEATGLLVTGLFLKGGQETERWIAKGSMLLEKHMREQVFEAGGSREQSTGYHRFVLELFTLAQVVGRNCGRPFSQEYQRRLEQMYHFLAEMTNKRGEMLHVGDSDDGRGFVLSMRKTQDVRGAFSTGAVLFDSGDLASRADGFDEESFWLTGEEGRRSFERLPAKAAPRRSVCLEGNNWVWLRQSESPASALFFDAGPQGIGKVSPHGHADALAVALEVEGCGILVDPGTGSYNLDQRWRDFFRGTRSHNTVNVGGLDQAEPDYPFRWASRAEAHLEVRHLGGCFEMVGASHDGYRRIGVRHMREAVSIPGVGYVIWDVLEGCAGRRLQWTWHFGCSTEVRLDRSESWVARSADGMGVEMHLSSPGSVRLVSGALEPIQGWVSGSYGTQKPAPVVEVTRMGGTMVHEATVMIPLGVAECVEVRQEAQGEGGLKLSMRRGDECIRLWVLSGTGRVEELGLMTDAERCVVCQHGDGSMAGVFQCVRRVVVKGEVKTNLDEAQPVVEVNW